MAAIRSSTSALPQAASSWTSTASFSTEYRMPDKDQYWVDSPGSRTPMRPRQPRDDAVAEQVTTYLPRRRT
ncbi:hypothetical protein ACIQZB_24385 [Streptomyces sp. NPDC097727]|uniref:hypothetical protein n=1 Tax=Streptomyces sp. NPDC097727 TaxID=3366092 RepID=UPI00382F12EF